MASDLSACFPRLVGFCFCSPTLLVQISLNGVLLHGFSSLRDRYPFVIVWMDQAACVCHSLDGKSIDHEAIQD